MVSIRRRLRIDTSHSEVEGAFRSFRSASTKYTDLYKSTGDGTCPLVHGNIECAPALTGIERLDEDHDIFLWRR